MKNDPAMIETAITTLKGKLSALKKDSKNSHDYGQAALQAGIEVLRMRKTRKLYKREDDAYVGFFCPTCGHAIGAIQIHTQVHSGFIGEYCPWCGQHIEREVQVHDARI